MEKIRDAIDSLEQELFMWLVGVSGILYKIIHYRITNWERVAKEATLCVFVCGVFIPFLKTNFLVHDTIAYLLVWSACTSTDSK
jgi:hypothetical protein